MGRLRGGQVFGNGTRFVWYFLGLQELQVAEAALVHAVEAQGLGGGGGLLQQSCGGVAIHGIGGV